MDVLSSSLSSPEKSVTTTSELEHAKDSSGGLVSAGNNCTVSVGQVKKIINNNGFFINGYSAINSFTPSTEAMPYALCDSYVDQTTNVANELCILEKGPGWIPDPNNNQNCIAYSCPDGFTLTNGSCVKPTNSPNSVNKNTMCQERTTDWLTIPNYHLGNKYMSNDGVCYQPCSKYSVPAYANDPVDKTSAGLFSKDDLTKCVSKADYFYGKYANTSDYCPLVWINRIGSTEESIKKELLDELNTTCSNETPGYTTLVNQIDQIAKELNKEFHSKLENVHEAHRANITACQTLNTTKRVTDAYNICTKVDTEEFLESWGAQFTDEVTKQKNLTVLKQACNAYFCNGPDIASTIDKKFTCFPSKEVKNIDLTNKTDNDDNIAPIEPNYNKLKYGLEFMLILIIGIPLLVLLLYLLYQLYRYLYKNYYCKLFPDTLTCVNIEYNLA